MNVRKLLHLRPVLGATGLAGLALMALAATFHFGVLKPMEAQNAQLVARASAQVARVAAGRPSTAAEQVAQVYEYLRKEEQTTDWLAKLHGVGNATGVQLKSAAYRAQPTAGPLVRYEIALPLSGSYAQIRDFLERALVEIPLMSLDQVTLKRQSLDDATIHGELRMTLHMVKS